MMIKRLYLIVFLLSTCLLLLAQESTSPLLLIERQALSRTPNEDVGTVLSRYPGLQLYHLTSHYLIGRMAEGTTPASLPKLSFTTLDIRGEEALYLLEEIPLNLGVIQPEAGRILRRIDGIILLASSLSTDALAQHTNLPFVKMDTHPIAIPQASAITPPPKSVDVQSLVSHVSADSILYFITTLQNMGTRNAHADNRQAVSEWIRQQFLRWGYSNAELQQFTQSGLEQWNVTATLTGNLVPDKYIVIGGHHDSIVFDGNDPLITAPGADDNASGAAAVMEIARVLKQQNYSPQCSILFMTYAMEEYGLYGSKYDAQVAADTHRDIKLMINHDMVANTYTADPSTWSGRLMPYSGSEAYTALAQQAMQDYSVLTPFIGALNSHSSDSYSYWQHGYPVIYFFETDFSPYYHSVNDIVANISAPYEAEIVKTSLASAVLVSEMPSAPDTLRVQDTGLGNSLWISWSRVGLESDVNHFEVRVLQDSTLISVYTPSDTLLYVPGLTNGQTYTVTLASVDNDGNHSLMLTGHGTPNIIPSQVQNLTAEPLYQAVKLTWTASPELDVAGYRLFRQVNDGPIEQLNAQTLIRTNEYTDRYITQPVWLQYSVQAVDMNGHVSAITPQVRTKAVTLQNAVLYVDESQNSSPAQDAEEDAFIINALDLTDIPVEQYDTADSGAPSLSILGSYQTVVWHSSDRSDFDYAFASSRNLKRYVELGGHLIVSMYRPDTAFEMNAGFPYTTLEGGFLREAAGVEEMHYSGAARFKYARHDALSFPDMQVDSLKALVGLNYHLNNVATMLIRQNDANARVIYTYGSDYADNTAQGELNGEPVGVINHYGEGMCILLSFPLYQMRFSDASAFLQHSLFALGTSTAEQVTPLAIRAVYPNPFTTVVRVIAQSRYLNAPAQADIYNIKGQKVRHYRLNTGALGVIEFNWDGRDMLNNPCGSGVYILQTKCKGKSMSRKLTLIK